jgi:hypothetical protein
VAGNHEHYGSLRSPGRSMDRTIEAYREAAAASGGRLVFLERASVEIAGCTIVGATLWTDFALFGADRVETAMREAARNMTDFHSIAWRPGMRFTPSHARAEFARAKAFLEAEFARPRPGPSIVVTHHGLLLRSVPSRFEMDRLSAAFSSRLDDLVERSGAALWVHGHTHDRAQLGLSSQSRHRGRRRFDSGRGAMICDAETSAPGARCQVPKTAARRERKSP